MKVIQVSKLFPPFWGGIETVVYDLATGLINKNVDTSVICVSDKNENITEYIDGVKVFRKGSIFHLASTYFSLSFIREWKQIRNNYDIVHVHLPNPLALVAIFAFRPRGKIIVHWHSDIIKQKILKLPFIPLQSWLLNKSSKIIATSEAYSLFSKDLSNHLDKVEVVPIGISQHDGLYDKEFYSSIKKKHKGKKIIFSLGRHVYYKGFEYLIEAAKFLPNDFVILIGGTGALSDNYKKIIESNNLNNKVKLVGRIEQSHISSYYKACDVFCLPSIERSEAFGVVQLEAMSYGKPVVSANIPGSGVSWVNKHEISGLICEPKDSKALSNALQESIGKFNPNDIKDYFEKKFSKTSMIDNTIKLYRGL